MGSINIRTELPGPKAKELLVKKEQNVPKGPFNTMQTFAAKGDGALLTDIDGNTFLDFAGAIGTLNVGHCPPRVVEALHAQIDQYLHPCFHVMMYEPYIKLAEKLNSITPGNHSKKTFFLSTGAEAVENAVKIARKYTGRKGIISFERGFHGRTYMSMSLTSKVKPYKYEFGPFAPETYKWPYPYYYRSEGLKDKDHDNALLKRFETFFLSEVPPEEVAAVIMEPVQGEGGFVMPSSHFIKGVKALCEKHGILFIADEVQTGFGRTGKMFAMEHYDVVPDLMTMSKSIGAGLPVSAVTGRADIMDSPNIGEIGGTYGGSPLGCAAALEVIRTIEEEGLLERANEIGSLFTEKFSDFPLKYKQVGEVRSLGAMCAIEFVKDQETKEPNKEIVQEILWKAHKRGLIIMSAGLYGNIIRLLSPLVTTNQQLDEGFSILEEVIGEYCT
ncbi:4-aminobutyrate--2-oxoglutarate transaminase [Cytobacillus firmus]|uniref:4-aminobutyrate--2-oxoglutarate transaminase n=1 Tax=Cytobacillus firmus TaxID=1399 RepID=UPI00077C248A|nr:4-aminobutyrate--2-oxoglutarate transaminase [Cytobacillus firmus]MBG9542756.1 4-aminobutyrate aminotransferase [Cytobacillus firmus]MBG9551414.1 4-aminobutyrate aminotransferase [Cytobacillus firmus]MBG9555847.1 4-aminobutyrate aminotransferase [Cytobacillus firmus]MBG9574049.1 4-aminobutyrate aminotransferase [Cytobacillus firmus]MBG9657060.1 4-aminobutyrate aminotransferase [Cytobacillus firmus]